MQFCGVNSAIFLNWKIATGMDETGATFVTDDCRYLEVLCQAEKQNPYRTNFYSK